jgi:hypothetical protein
MNRRKVKWVLPASLGVLLCVVSHRAEARNQDSAKKLYNSGQLAEAKDDVIAAYEDYAQAFKKDQRISVIRPRGSALVLRRPRLMFPAGKRFASRGITAGL